VAAFNIQSAEQGTESSLKRIFEFLTDFNNFKSILPEDKIENFQCAADSCSFNIRGITPLSVKLKSTVPHSNIQYDLTSMGKFNFILEVNLIGTSEAPGKATIAIHGDMNPFLKTLAEKPLEQLVNSMAKKLGELKLS
jgi:hypothetical protein